MLLRRRDNPKLGDGGIAQQRYGFLGPPRIAFGDRNKNRIEIENPRTRLTPRIASTRE